MRNYLCNIQPFMIERFSSEERSKTVLCVLDHSYKISLYIKVDTRQFDECVISFHESNHDGIAIKSFQGGDNRDVLVLCDVIGDNYQIGEYGSIEVTFPKGFKLFAFQMNARCVQSGVFFVALRELNANVLYWCEERIEQFRVLAGGNVAGRLSTISRLTFTSYGDHLLNDISLLIDYAASISAAGNRSDAVFLLESKLESLLLDPNSGELVDALYKRYSSVADTSTRKLFNTIFSITGRYLNE